MRNPFRRKALTASPAVVEALRDGTYNPYQRLGGVNQQVNGAWQMAQSSTYGWMYRTQPSVRAVVDFVARNVAQLGLKLYERVSDTERERREDHPAALTMAHPDPDGFMPADRFIFNLVADFLINENAYAIKFRAAPDAPRVLIQIPAPYVAILSSARYTIQAYRVYRSDGTYVDVPAADMIHWRGYNPADPRMGISKLETLRQVIAEDAASQTASVELMKSGLQGPGYITRPLEAPEWTEPARQRFEESWANRAKSSTRKTPVLEEGMEFVPGRMSPKDAELLAGRRFTIEEVARVYGVPLGVLGLEPATDLAEQRKQVYADVLPPITEELACVLDVTLLQAEYGEDDFYFEFDLNEKLRGDLENRFSAMTSAAGRPWATVNEIRARENLPAIDGGDELTIPLNVMLQGGALPAPNVMPLQDPNKPPQDGSYRLNGAKALSPGTLIPHRAADMERQRGYIAEAKGILDRFYARQAREVKSKGTLDASRWDRELTDDLHGFLTRIVDREASIYTLRLAGQNFDLGQVEHYVKAMAEGIATNLNAATERDAVETSLAEALNRAQAERAGIAAAGIGARATLFARREAAAQAPGTEHRRQVWIADTDRHADLDGVAVPLDSDWGGISPGSEPNCACSASIE